MKVLTNRPTTAVARMPCPRGEKVTPSEAEAIHNTWCMYANVTCTAALNESFVCQHRSIIQHVRMRKSHCMHFWDVIILWLWGCGCGTQMDPLCCPENNKQTHLLLLDTLIEIGQTNHHLKNKVRA
ncbi:hypothetical protein GBA52_002362 [Prunus armeniaca]|nr:hypothetical protein GBA52_002362 [Prunus armeniaca]